MARRSKRLARYEDKRDFARTPEPVPRARGRGSSRFVVHRHDARNLHYDLRLEIDGVLCSWAVPKGFSYDPRDKRLAVRTEDHPIEYLTYHGVIPPGEYGAGTMTIWDEGDVQPVDARHGGAGGLAAGELKVVLRGRRLRGEWHLVRTAGRAGERRGGDDGKQHWLLFKSRDRYAGPKRDAAWGVALDDAPRAAMPRAVRVMTPADTRAPFVDPEWMFEMDVPGRRVLAEWRDGRAHLRGLRRTPDALAADLADLRAEAALLDGVLVAVDDDGRPSDPRGAGRDAPLVYYAFDLLHVDDFDLRPLPLAVRKAALRTAIRDGSEALLFVDHVVGDAPNLCAALADLGLRGAIGKRADSPCTPGPSDAWCRVDAAGVAPRPRAPERRSRPPVSNPDKLLFPVDGITKADLIGYYDDVADALVPYLCDRPVHLLRYPDGIEAEGFYQHKAPDGAPDWLRTVEIPRSSRAGTVLHAVCDDRRSLLYLVNLGSIDLHPWLSRVQHLDAPDLALFDLDPKGAPIADVVAIAVELGDVLRRLGLRPSVKTSGKTGIHVVVPVAPIGGARGARLDFDQVRMFCEAVARHVCRRLPEIATVERQVSQRGGRVYVDVMQNRRGQTIVPPHVVRPVLGATVSTPLRWDEVVPSLDPSRFTREVARARLAEHGDLFAGALDDPQDLVPAIERLDELLRER